MTSDVVIRAEGLGKKYIIGHQSAERYTALRDVMARSARNWARSLRDMAKGAANIAGDEIEEFWALKDVDFEVRRGDVVGVIGRNGAGKSTLLKVMSRITEPTKGRVEIRGRVASLLEVGTGFHPELTGRENIYLNGAILGMSRAEIKSKFDEIVAFAEIDKFLDTPVKRYSSGMYVRLAFAVAAHLDPEILIIDEVLAVGDAEFQKKCLGKMQDVAGGGRTVLFVSHNMSAVGALCNKGILLNSGRVVLGGDIAPVIERYKAASTRSSKIITETRPGDSSHWIESAEVTHLDGQLFVSASIRGVSAKSLILNLKIRDSLGTAVGMASLGGFNPDEQIKVEEGLKKVDVRIKLPKLANGFYELHLNLEEPYSRFLHTVKSSLVFEVLRPPPTQHGRVLDSRWDAGSVELTAELVRSKQIEGEVEPAPVGSTSSR